MDHTYKFLTRKSRCAEEFRRALHDLCTMSDDELRVLYRELLW